MLHCYKPCTRCLKLELGNIIIHRNIAIYFYALAIILLYAYYHVLIMQDIFSGTGRIELNQASLVHIQCIFLHIKIELCSAANGGSAHAQDLCTVAI